MRKVAIPFELAAEFFPGMDKQSDDALTRLMQGMPPEAAESLAVTVAPEAESIPGYSLNEAFSLPETIAVLARHYLERAMAQTRGNKSEGARLLGSGNYQTLSNWLHKYEME
jgi:DNA-binding NtrC family response regulator